MILTCPSSFPVLTLPACRFRAYAHKVTLDFSRLGKPTDHAYIESFNGSLREECLNVHWFEDLTDARAKMQVWQQEYNEERPHRSSRT